MALSSTTSKLSFAGNNSTSTAYALTGLRYDAAAWLVVSTVAADGTIATLTNGVHFTLGGDGTAGTGTLTSTAGNAIPVTSTLRVVRATPRTQTTDLENNVPLDHDAMETALDKAAMIDQDAAQTGADNLARSIRVPDGETAAQLPAAATRKGTLPYFHATTGAVETKTPNQILALSDGAPTGIGLPSGGTSAQILEGNSPGGTWIAKTALTTGTDATLFFDDFSRADTASSAIGSAPSGQPWTVTGSGAANTRITGNALVQVSSYGTYYAWPTLAFTPTRVGCMFRIRPGGGGTSYVAAMAMTSAAVDLTAYMLHFTFNANNCSIEVWNGGTGLGHLETMTFVQPLADNAVHCLEWEVDAANDTVTIYGPHGEVLVYTDAAVSNCVAPHIFYEVSATTSSLKLIDFLATWALDRAASNRTHYEGRIAEWRSRAGRGFTRSGAITIDGNFTSSSGVLSFAADQNSTHSIGRAKIFSPSSDYVGFSHFDFTSFAAGGILVGPFGNTIVSSATGQGISLSINNGVTASVYADRLELHAGKTLSFEGSTADAFETFLTVQDPTQDNTQTLLNASGTVPLWTSVPATATSTGVTGQMAADSTHLYICTATNTWRRVAIAAW